MTINDDFKSWCVEDYDQPNEQYYIKNAYYIADRERVIFEKHQGILAILVGILYSGSRTGQMDPSILEAAYWFCAASGVVLIAAYLCGIIKYYANDKEFAAATYILAASSFSIVLWLTTQSTMIMSLISIVVLFRLIIVLIVHPIQFHKLNSDFRKETIRFAEFKKKAYENAYKEKTTKNNTSHNAYEKSESESQKRVHEQTSTQYQSEETKRAFGLFNNCDHNDIGALKRRFRLLAKQYHPDHGGDTQFFQCIVSAYEELIKNIEK